MRLADGSLHCDMLDGCKAKVTHIGEKGYIYCSAHAPDRRGVERYRRLLVSERKALERGDTIPSFDRRKVTAAPNATDPNATDPNATDQFLDSL